MHCNGSKNRGHVISSDIIGILCIHSKTMYIIMQHFDHKSTCIYLYTVHVIYYCTCNIYCACNIRTCMRYILYIHISSSEDWKTNPLKTH